MTAWGWEASEILWPPAALTPYSSQGAAVVLARRPRYTEELVTHIRASLSRPRPALWASLGCGVSSAGLEARLEQRGPQGAHTWYLPRA